MRPPSSSTRYGVSADRSGDASRSSIVNGGVSEVERPPKASKASRPKSFRLECLRESLRQERLRRDSLAVALLEVPGPEECVRGAEALDPAGPLRAAKSLGHAVVQPERRLVALPDRDHEPIQLRLGHQLTQRRILAKPLRPGAAR